jgi:hypothetical protein
MLIIVDYQEFLYIINNIKIQYKIIEERVLLSSLLPSLTIPLYI